MFTRPSLSVIFKRFNCFYVRDNLYVLKFTVLKYYSYNGPTLIVISQHRPTEQTTSFLFMRDSEANHFLEETWKTCTWSGLAWGSQDIISYLSHSSTSNISSGYAYVTVISVLMDA